MGTLRFFSFVFLMCLFSVNVSAQSTADKEYSQGKILQRTMTIQKQKEAIKRFEAAKIMYNSAEGKKKCDKEIAQCKSNLKSLSGKPKPAPSVPSVASKRSKSFINVEREIIQQCNEMGLNASVKWYTDYTSVDAFVQMWSDNDVYYTIVEFEGPGEPQQFSLDFFDQDYQGNYLFYVEGTDYQLTMYADESTLVLGNKSVRRISVQQCDQIMKK